MQHMVSGLACGYVLFNSRSLVVVTFIFVYLPFAAEWISRW